MGKYQATYRLKDSHQPIMYRLKARCEWEALDKAVAHIDELKKFINEPFNLDDLSEVRKKDLRYIVLYSD